MPEVERPKALSTDAYKWSQKVGAGRTDRKRPRLHGRKANKAFILRKGCWRFSWDSAENLNDGADGEQSPPSRLGIVSES